MLWEHWQKEKEIIDYFFLLFLVPYFFLCGVVVVLKQQYGIIHIPLQVVHFVLDVELLQVTRSTV